MKMQFTRRIAFRSLAMMLATVVLATLVLPTLVTAQTGGAKSDSAKKSYTFKGTVTTVDAKTNNLVVDGEDVEGWMGAMSMKYDVDDPNILKQLKVGDHIQATVYDSDYKLYHVHVVAATGTSNKKK